MSLIECHECHLPISDKATKCPHCGYPVLVTKAKASIPRLLCYFIVWPTIAVFQFLRYITRRLIKPSIVILFIVSSLILFKNYYFISQAESLAWTACQSTLGKDISINETWADPKRVPVPSSIHWYRLESRVGDFFDLDIFDFYQPYVWGRIDIYGLDKNEYIWVCTPHIEKGSFFSKQPYNSDRILRIKQIEN